MIIIHRDEITYYLKTESVIVGIRDMQFLSYSVYPLQNRKPFYDFKRTILKSLPTELGKAADVIVLSKKHRLRGFPTGRPNLEGVSYHVLDEETRP